MYFSFKQVNCITSSYELFWNRFMNKFCEKNNVSSLIISNLSLSYEDYASSIINKIYNYFLIKNKYNFINTKFKIDK